MRTPSPDPYADFGGGVATTPAATTAPTDPYAEFGGAAATAPTTQQQQTAQQPTGTGDWMQDYQADIAAGRNPQIEGAKRDWEKVKGVAKTLARTGAGIVDVLNTDKYTGGTTLFTGDAVPYSQTIRHLTDAVRARMQPTNIMQEKGDFAGSALELMALPGLGGEEAATTLAEKFGIGADIAKFADKYPKLAAAWNVLMEGAKTGARAGGEQGAQTYLKTGDPKAAEESAETGLEWGAPLGMAGKAAEETANAITKGRAGTRTVAGADFETNPKTKKLVLRNTEDVTQDPATQAVDEALGNIAKTGVANSMNRTNAARAPVGEIIPPSRQLPGRAGFTMRTTPPEFVGGTPRTTTNTVLNGSQTVSNPDYEAPAGELTRSPGQTAEQTAGEIGEGATTATPERSYAGPGDVDTRNPTQQRLDAARGLVPRRMIVPPETVEQPVYQQQPVTTQPQETVVTHPERETVTQPNPQRLGGGGTMILTDDGQAMSPERARQQVAQYERILNDPDEVDQLGVREHQNLLRAHADLSDQLSRYDNYAASQPHFPAADPVEAVRNTDSLGDAAEQIKAAHSPVWQAADDASGGEWTKLREREKWLRNKLNSKNPVGNWDELNTELGQNQQDQMAFFDKYKTTVSPQEAKTAISGWQDGAVLQNLDDFFQRKFGGISRELEQRGLATGNKRQRVFQPTKDFNQQLENFYNEGTNREVLQRTIGQDHMDSLHDLGQMFNSTERMEQMQGLMKTTLRSIYHHYHGIKGMLAGGAGALMIGGSVGAKAAGVAGAPLLTGTAAGINRYIGERLITDPGFLKNFTYAMQNKIPSQTAGPLLAARIIASWENRSKQPAQQQPQEKP